MSLPVLHGKFQHCPSEKLQEKHPEIMFCLDVFLHFFKNKHDEG